MRTLAGASPDITQVGLPPAKIVFKDAAPLSDIRISRSGALCCLRRGRSRVDFLVWDNYLAAAMPYEWNTCTTDIVEIVDFDGITILAKTRNGLLEVRDRTVNTLYESEEAIIRAARSPDGSKVLWTQRRGPNDVTILRFGRIDCARLVSVIEVGPYLMGAWWGPDTIVCIEPRYAEQAFVISRYSTKTAQVARMLSTQRYIRAVAADERGLWAALFAQGFLGNHTDREAGAWLLTGQESCEVTRVSDLSAGRSAFVAGGQCLFADSSASPSESRLVVAGSIGHVGWIPYPVSDFAVTPDGTACLFRAFGTSGAILKQDIQALAFGGAGK
jgi:hypothetical protein